MGESSGALLAASIENGSEPSKRQGETGRAVGRRHTFKQVALLKWKCKSLPCWEDTSIHTVAGHTSTCTLIHPHGDSPFLVRLAATRQRKLAAVCQLAMLIKASSDFVNPVIPIYKIKKMSLIKWYYIKVGQSALKMLLFEGSR